MKLFPSILWSESQDFFRLWTSLKRKGQLQQSSFTPQKGMCVQSCPSQNELLIMTIIPIRNIFFVALRVVTVGCFPDLV